MKAAVLFLLGVSTAFAAVSASPSGCVNSSGVISVHPCTATVTFAGTSADPTELAQLQAVFDSAWRGDTLITPAKDVSSCSLQMTGTNMGGAADAYFTWKSEHYDTKFPTDDSTITQAYRPLMTRISCNNTASSREFRVRGRLSRSSSAVVDGMKIQGIAFIHGYTTNITNSRSGSLAIGESAVIEAVTDAATSTSDNLTYTATDADLQVWLYSASATIKRNGVDVDPAEYTWLPWYGKVTFLAAQAPGDVITISGSTFTSTLPEHQPNRIIVKHCILDGESDLDRRIITRMLQVNGRNLQVIGNHFEGSGSITGDSQSIQGEGGYGPFLITNNYVGGGAENYMSGGATNTMGSWNVRGLTYRYNYNPQEDWYNFQQRAGSTWYRKGVIVRQDAATDASYIAETSGTTGSGTPTWNATIGAQTTDGAVTWRRLPAGRQHRIAKNNFELKQMDDAVIELNYFHRMWAADQGCSINFKTENSNAGNNPFTTTRNIIFRNNVVDNGYCAINTSTNPLGSAAFGPLYVYNNVWRGFNVANRWSAATSVTDGTRCALKHLSLGGVSDNQSYFENNLIDAWAGAAACSTGAGAYNQGNDNSGNWIVRNNIFTRTGTTGQRPGFWGATSAETEGSIYIRIRMKSSIAESSATPVPAGRWDKNIHSGAPANTYPGTATGDTGNTSYNTARDSIGFRNATDANFRLATASPFYRDGTDGKPIGPNFSQIPGMENFTVTASDREALFTWDLSPALTDRALANNGLTAACVATVGARDLLTLAGDLDPATYTRPNLDNNDIHVRRGAFRMIRIGSRSALTPSTIYGYRIQCPGYAKEGTFTTSAALVGTASHTITFVPTSGGTQTLTWGPTYSAATNAISGGGAPTATCSAGASCSISFTGTRGQTYYVKVNSGVVRPVMIP